MVVEGEVLNTPRGWDEHGRFLHFVKHYFGKIHCKKYTKVTDLLNICDKLRREETIYV